MSYLKFIAFAGLWLGSCAYEPFDSEEYTTLCQPCEPGKHMIVPCSPPHTSTQCLPCGEGEFIARSNFREKCFRCSECEENMIQEHACNATHDTQCSCLPGYEKEPFFGGCSRIPQCNKHEDSSHWEDYNMCAEWLMKDLLQLSASEMLALEKALKAKQRQTKPGFNRVSLFVEDLMSQDEVTLTNPYLLLSELITSANIKNPVYNNMYDDHNHDRDGTIRNPENRKRRSLNATKSPNTELHTMKHLRKPTGATTRGRFDRSKSVFASKHTSAQ
ncbi:ORF136a-like protein [Bufonid herpesvirus 1]|uniref:ORF136a-like protein n=1 Tax=Bufonid herpesvirus 1 TaxID=2282206 RepID=UPI000EB77F5F|nr:ORF136a-like protein [Bufonid herpesvirus 1]AXF48526.1 ORF136a-like protein [Bufonid herpesvirus 1]